jgi:hypothetical protein
VPWTFTIDKPLALALKSGNFGGDGFFTSGLGLLPCWHGLHPDGNRHVKYIVAHGTPVRAWLTAGISGNISLTDQWLADHADQRPAWPLLVPEHACMQRV